MRMNMTKAVITFLLTTLGYGFIVLFLLTIGRRRGILSGREFSIGLTIFAVSLVVLGLFVAWRMGKKLVQSFGGPGASIEDRAREFHLWSLRRNKWKFAFMCVTVPLGIVYGIWQHLGLATLGAVGVALLYMYATWKNIERLEKILNAEPPAKA
jgi:hypothetical protein